MGLIGRGVSCIYLKRCDSERFIKIAHRSVRGPAESVALGRGRSILRLIETKGSTCPDVFCQHEPRGCTGLLEGLGDNDGDRLMIVLDFRAPKQFSRIALPLAQLADVRGGYNRQHARSG